MVLLGGHAWFYSGGMCGFIQGGIRGFIRGVCGFIWGGMRGFSGGRAWFFWGGMRGFFSFFGYNEIRSMSGRYASYWNAFLLGWHLPLILVMNQSDMLMLTRFPEIFLLI